MLLDDGVVPFFSVVVVNVLSPVLLCVFLCCPCANLVNEPVEDIVTDKPNHNHKVRPRIHNEVAVFNFKESPFLSNGSCFFEDKHFLIHSLAV